MNSEKRKILRERFLSVVNSLIDGEFLFRIHIDRAFKYIAGCFLALIMIVCVHYLTDKALSEEKIAKEELRIAKSKYDMAYCEYMGLIRESNIKELARNNGLKLDTPKQPAIKLK